MQSVVNARGQGYRKLACGKEEVDGEQIQIVRGRGRLK